MAASRQVVLPTGKLLTGLLALVVATCSPAQDNPSKTPLQSQSGQPVTVDVAAARDLFMYPVREALAVVLARNESRIAAQVTAVVASIDARVGQVVPQGEVLATLDDTDIRLSLAQALAARDGLQARLNLARRQLKRLRELKTNNFVSTEAVNQRDAEVVSLRAELKGAAAQVVVIERQLDKCLIRAPFNAVVSERTAQLGELAVPGAVLFTLVELGGEQVSASVPADDAAHLGQATRPVLLAAGRQVPLELVRVSPVLSRQTRAQQVRLRFANAGVTLPAGAEGRLRWQDPRPHLPPDVQVRRNGQLGVFVLRDNKAQFVPAPGAQEGRPVLSPVAPGTMVIRDGQAQLQPGAAVRASQASS